jgi:hypothetical protein
MLIQYFRELRICDKHCNEILMIAEEQSIKIDVTEGGVIQWYVMNG